MKLYFNNQQPIITYIVLYNTILFLTSNIEYASTYSMTTTHQFFPADPAVTPTTTLLTCVENE
jgi:hypothetical protein